MTELSRTEAVVHGHQCMNALFTEGDRGRLRRSSHLEPLQVTTLPTVGTSAVAVSLPYAAIIVIVITNI